MSLPFQPQYPIILQPSGGDLDNQVFTKTRNEFTANYNEHQNIAIWYESSSAPLNPVNGQKWKDTSTSPPTLRRFNGTIWITELFDIGNTPSGNIVSITTQSAINEIDSKIGAGRSSKNGIINSNCIVNQRPTATLSTTAQYGSVDRFACYGSGSSVSAGTITQDTSSTLGQEGYALYISGVTITGSGQVFARHRIESANSKKYINKSISFQAKVLHDVGSTINYVIIVNKANAVDNFSSITNIYTGSSIPVTNAIGTTITANIPNIGSCGNGLEIIIRADCGAITTKNFRFTEWQFEEGNVCTSIEYFPYDKILSSCQRYCRAVSYVTNQYVAVGNSDASAVYGTLQSGIQMRINPTQTATITLANWSVFAGSVISNPTSLSPVMYANGTGTIVFTKTSSFTVGSCYMIYVTSPTILIYDAEL